MGPEKRQYTSSSTVILQ